MGRLVAFEGIDRAGKSSVIERLQSFLVGCNVPITICGELCSPIAPTIRELLHGGGSPFLKAFLFACDRAWSYERVGLPALEAGGLVLWDRYVDSAVVYRTVELAVKPSIIDLDFVKDINRPFREADLTIYIDISIESVSTRAKLSGKNEPYSLEFLEKVRTEYLKLASEKGYCIIDGEPSLDTVAGQTNRIIRQHLKELFQ